MVGSKNHLSSISRRGRIEKFLNRMRQCGYLPPDGGGGGRISMADACLFRAVVTNLSPVLRKHLYQRGAVSITCLEGHMDSPHSHPE